jgi:hypothetical protein
MAAEQCTEMKEKALYPPLACGLGISSPPNHILDFSAANSEQFENFSNFLAMAGSGKPGIPKRETQAPSLYTEVQTQL